MSAEVAQVLRDAKALIADPLFWTRGSFAVFNEVGQECYCALGAASEAARADGLGEQDVWRVLAAATKVTPEERHWLAVAEFNDDPSTTHADVMALFDRAIAAEEASS